MGDRERTHDRHHIPPPVPGATQTATGTYVVSDKLFLDGFKERIHELFLTLPGLPGHVQQVQQEFNRLSNSNLPYDRKLAVGRKAFEQIVKAAKYASINFPQQTFRIASVSRTFYVERRNGRVTSSERYEP
jgi:hypothetical protein